MGPYRLEGVLGAGGMGRVYLGRTPAGSAVAVKVVHREYAGDVSFRKRFEQEVAAARRVQGLYTVPVVDADLRADEPWLATAYVPGPSLQHAVAEAGPLPVDAAVRLVATVAEALQSIHAADVIHRDLKPSNIILTGDGPKVIDFGIARAADVTSVTGTGMRTGTPAYMAPEYITGQDVTEAGDVFALGVIAHFAATGRLAFGGGSAHSVTYRILEQEPDLDGCPEPLRAVAARCLVKDPQQRPTPAEVIEQCRPAAAPGIADADTRTAPAAPAAAPAAPAAPAGPGLHDAATSPAGSPAGSPPALPTMRDPVRVAAPGPPATSPDPDTGPASRLPVLLGGAGTVVVIVVAVLLAAYLPSSTDRGPGIPYPSFKPTDSLTATGSSGSFTDVAFSPDGKLLAGSDLDGSVQLWDAGSRKPSATLSPDGSPTDVSTVASLAFSPDGKLLATGGDDKVELWDVAERRRIRSLHESGLVNSVAFSPDGKTLASGNELGDVTLWDTGSKKDKELAVLDGETDVVNAVAFSADGKTLATAGSNSQGNPDGTAVLWDLHSRKARATLRPGGSLSTVAFSPDGKTLATTGIAEEVRLWNVASGHQKASLDDSYAGSSGYDMSFSPDGKTLATPAYNGVWLWNVAGREPRARLSSKTDTKKTNGAEEVAFSPNGRLIAATGHERPVQVWENP
nr:protein kinase [Streptomyces sp. DSM 40971]